MNDFWAALKHIFRSPSAALMTIWVIGIAIALPLGFYITVHQIQWISQHWNTQANISVYLKDSIRSEQIQSLIQRLHSDELRFIRHIRPEEAAKQIQQSSLAEALNQLDFNPLPHSLQFELTQPEHLSVWLQKLNQLPEVDQAIADQAWIQKMIALTELFQRGVMILTLLLGLAVLMIIANTIRLEVQNQKETIEIILLIGGTPNFIRRPFLYQGIWYGLLGAALAILLIGLAVLFLSGPIAQLQMLYQTEWSIQIPSILIPLTLLISAMLGAVGAVWSVNRSIKF